MIEELGRVVSIFADYPNTPFGSAKDKRWTLDVIQKIQGKVELSLDMADKIKDELIGDGREAEFRGRLRTAFFELSGDPFFAPSYFPVFDEALFCLPTEDYPDRNKEKLEALTANYGNKACLVMVALESICSNANWIVGKVRKMLDDVCKFVGYEPQGAGSVLEALQPTEKDEANNVPPEPQQGEQRPQEATESELQTSTRQEPQQAEQEQHNGKRGRPVKDFRDIIIGSKEEAEQRLKKIRYVAQRKTGKDFCLVIVAARHLEWMANIPSYGVIKQEFGEMVCSKSNYNVYTHKYKHEQDDIQKMAGALKNAKIGGE